MTEVKQVNGEQPHFWTLVLAAERRPLHSDLKWLRIAPQLGITCSSTVFLQMKIFYFCLSTLVFFFFFFSFSWLSYTIFGEILRFQNGRSNPHWTLYCDHGETRTVAKHYRKTTWPFCVHFLYVCVRACVRVCVIKCAWMCGCVKLHTSILYNTASAICHRGELTHELNRDKEQIYLKQLRYILWTTVKHSFLLNPKKKWT